MQILILSLAHHQRAEQKVVLVKHGKYATLRTQVDEHALDLSRMCAVLTAENAYYMYVPKGT